MFQKNKRKMICILFSSTNVDIATNQQLIEVFINCLFLKHIFNIDTEEWSNEAENSALHHRNKLHFKTYSNRKYFNNISNFLVFTVFLIK